MSSEVPPPPPPSSPTEIPSPLVTTTTDTDTDTGTTAAQTDTPAAVTVVTIPDVEAPVSAGKRKKKRRKKSTPESSLRKQHQMEENEKMVAWKLASRQRGYFQPRSFDRLPKKGTPAWQKIWTTRTAILDKHWKGAAKKLGASKSYIRLRTKELDAYASNGVTPERKSAITELLTDPVYTTIKTEQRISLQNEYREHKLKQQKRMDETWTKAQEDTNSTELLREMPAEKSKTFKTWLKEPLHKEAYTKTTDRHKELLAINPL